MTWGVAIHGGAGAMPASLTKSDQKSIAEALDDIVSTAAASLQSDVAALDVVQAAVEALEDCPFFNAGIGAVLTREGRHELEASIMDGSTGRAGAACGLTRVRRPIRMARAVMDRTDHVFLGGPAAERCAAEWNLQLVDNSTFTTTHRKDQLDAWLEHKRPVDRRHHATVGAVACDVQGRLASATSTGGMTGKMSGRIGDTPLIGAGTWADAKVAVSATGQGEMFILASTARMVGARMQFAGECVEKAAEQVLASMPPEAGGLIAVDYQGRTAMPFTSPGMHCAARSAAI